MLQPPPARPGMREDEVDTPALLIDLDAFEANLDHMAELLAPTGAKLRAHAKTHKCPEIGKRGLIAMDRMWDNGFRQITSSTRPIREPARAIRVR